MAQEPDNYDERLQRIFAAKANGDARYLIGALRDPDHRDVAARFLGTLGEAREVDSVEAVAPLMRLLDAREPHARAASATALGQLAAAEAVPRLISVAQHDPVVFVRSWAIFALGKIGDRRVLPTLLPMLDDPEWKIRRVTAMALGWLGDTGSLDALQRASANESLFRRRRYREAIRAIRAMSASVGS